MFVPKSTRAPNEANPKCVSRIRFHCGSLRDAPQLSGFQGQAYRGYLSEQHGRPDHATAACGCKVLVRAAILTASLAGQLTAAERRA